MLLYILDNNENMEYKKSIFSEISNTIFLVFTLFLITFLWCNFYLRNFSHSLICSAIIILTFSLIYIPHKINKYKKNKYTTAETDKKNYYKNQLLLSNNKEIINFITNLYEYKNIEFLSDNHAFTDNKDIFICFNEEELTNSKIYDFFKQSVSNDIYVYSLNKPNFSLKINNKKISYYNFSDLMTKCKEKNTFFDNNIIIEKKTKLRVKDVLCIVLGKERSKSYLYLGSLILFSSLFTPYNIYYIVISSILFILSIFSKFNKFFN